MDNCNKIFSLIFTYLFLVLGMETQTSHILGKSSITELHPQLFYFLKKYSVLSLSLHFTIKIGLHFTLSLLLYMFPKLMNYLSFILWLGFHCGIKQNSIHNQISLLEGLFIVLNRTTEDFWKSMNYKCTYSWANNQFLTHFY